MRYIHPTEYFKWLCGHSGSLGRRIWFIYGYYKLRHRFPNIANPSNLSEYIISNVLRNDWCKSISHLADKCMVRLFVEEQGYSQSLLKVYGEWTNVDDIDLDNLPNRFALKANNGCGNHVYCADKSAFNLDDHREQLVKNMTLDNIMFKFEPHYSYIVPKIYAEELMEIDPSHGIIDYKFFCVRGNICGIQVIGNRQGENYDMLLKNTKWDDIEGLSNDQSHNKSIFFPKPDTFEQMKKMAADLSRKFDFVRVDLYEYKGVVKFGEMTFTPGGALLSSFTLSFLEKVFHEVKSQKQE